jgi:hypothetical protein
MDLELVEQADGERQLRRRRAMDQHVIVAGSLLGSGDRGLDVAHVGDERPVPDVYARPLAAVDEDRHAVVAPLAMNSSSTKPDRRFGAYAGGPFVEP